MALLLLRVALGVTLLAFCARSVVAPDPGWKAVTAGILTGASGLAMLIGIATPFASVVAGLTVALTMHWSGDSSAGLLGGRAENLLVVAVAAALALLGPGAYSLDARIFGRREMSFPPERARLRTRGEAPEGAGSEYHDGGSEP
jgi:uncharacterized membrane protein YphA (DoxX/SURF4 family)